MSLLCIIFLFLRTSILFISSSSFCTIPVDCWGADGRDCSRRGRTHGRRPRWKAGVANAGAEGGAEGESYVFLAFFLIFTYSICFVILLLVLFQFVIGARAAEVAKAEV